MMGQDEKEAATESEAETLPEPKVTTLQVSSVHKFIASSHLPRVFQGLANVTEGRVQESIGLRLLLMRWMQKVIRGCSAAGVRCLQDLKVLFNLQRIMVNSANGEAYFLQSKRGQLRCIRFVAKLTSPVNRGQIGYMHLINRLVTKTHIPHFPLFYGSLFCPPLRCKMRSPALMSEHNIGALGCEVFFMEAINGGMMDDWIERDMLTRYGSAGIPMMHSLVAQTLLAIYALHSHLRMAHHDVHMGNIMLSMTDAARQQRRVKSRRTASDGCGTATTATATTAAAPPSQPTAVLHYRLLVERDDALDGSAVRPTDKGDSNSSSDSDSSSYSASSQTASDDDVDDEKNVEAASQGAYVDIYVPYYGIMTYIIDFDYLGSDTFAVNSESGGRYSLRQRRQQQQGQPLLPAYQTDYFRFFEHLVFLLDRLGIQFDGTPIQGKHKDEMVYHVVELLLPANRNDFFMDDPENARFGYKPLSWSRQFVYDFLAVFCPSFLSKPADLPILNPHQPMIL